MDESLLEVCSVCMKYMNDPRILPCAHSFCLKCLESSKTSNDSSNCPKCQMDFEIPQGGLKDLKRNAFIERLSILKQDGITCDSCKVTPAVKFCVDCSFNYCSTCLEHHARIPIARNHLLQPATSTKVEIAINKYSNCDEHSELMTLVCENCKIVVCSHCFSLNHKNHHCIHLSNYFDSLKFKFEEKLKIKEGTIVNVIKNMKSSEDTMHDNEVKASNLKKQIKKRGEDAKKMIDSIVDAINQTIDEELKQYQHVAEKVLKNLKNMEEELKEQIETLRHQLENLSYANVTEIGFNTVFQYETVPNYSEKFCASFNFDEDLKKIEKIFVNPQISSPQMRLVEEEILKGTVESITSYEGELCCLKRFKNDSLGIWRKKSKDSKDISNVKFDKKLFGIGNLLAIDDKFFISGVSEIGHQYILNVLKNANNWELFKIFEHPPIRSEKNMPRMSKSICGNILVNIFCKILILSRRGVVMKKIKVSFHIQDVLQLDEESYAVCGVDEVHIIDDKANILVKHLYHSSFDGLRCNVVTTLRLAKDRHGNIYVYDSTASKLFVSDHRLRIKSTFDVTCCLREIVYEEMRNVLMISCENHSLITYAL